MNTIRFKYIAAAILLVTGSLLLLATTDREYINLAPTEGIPNGIVMQSNNTYQQSFVANRTNINRLGIFLRPNIKNIPAGEVTVQLSRDSQVIAEQLISTAFIDSDGSSQVRFDPVIPTTPGETLAIKLRVPALLDGSVRLQTRQLDETFDASNVSFSINGATQNVPVGYQVYYQYHPVLAIQLGGLLILLAAVLITRLLNLYLIGLALLFIAPAIMLGGFPISVLIYSLLALFTMSWLLKQRGLPLIPTLLGAYIFAFTSWFPLHYLADRHLYLLAGLLPLFFLPRPAFKQRRLSVIVLLIAAAIILTSNIQTDIALLIGSANPRDVFLDPNQVPSSIKVIGASWDNFGSYVGPYAAVLALIGLLWKPRQHRAVLVTGLLGAALALALPHLIILATFAIAYFAAQGISGLQRFLQPDSSTPGRAALAITIIISTIILFDLWQVATRTLEFNLL